MAEDLKVLLVSAFHPELSRGGSQQVCFELFSALGKQPGIRPFFLAAARRETLPFSLDPSERICGFDGRKDEYLLVPATYDGSLFRSTDPQLLEQYAEFLAAVNPQVVHFHHFFSVGIDLLTMTRRLLPKAKIVFTFHEFLSICAADGQMVRRTDGTVCGFASPVRCHQCIPERSPQSFFVREQWIRNHLSAADVFTCPGLHMIDRYVEWGLPRDRLRYVENGQDNLNLFGVPAVAGRDTPYKEFNRFGYFGQMLEAKGIEVLLNAVDLLRKQGFTNFRLEINSGKEAAGSDRFRALIQEFVRREQQRPLAKRLVFFNGEYSRSELAARMKRVDWCVVPSIWVEGAPLVINEARMFGKPIICSNFGAMAERVSHDVDGILFERGDSESLALAIQRACNDDRLCRRLSSASPAPPSLTKMVAEFSELYRST